MLLVSGSWTQWNQSEMVNKCTSGHLNFFSEWVSSFPSPSTHLLHSSWQHFTYCEMRWTLWMAEDDFVGGPHIWTYRLKRGALMEFSSDRRSVGSDLWSFGITWIISWLTKVIISLNSVGKFHIHLNLSCMEIKKRIVFLVQFSLVLSPRQCLSLIFESCLNVRNQEGISRTLMYWQSLKKSPEINWIKEWR